MSPASFEPLLQPLPEACILSGNGTTPADHTTGPITSFPAGGSRQRGCQLAVIAQSPGRILGYERCLETVSPGPHNTPLLLHDEGHTPAIVAFTELTLAPSSSLGQNATTSQQRQEPKAAQLKKLGESGAFTFPTTVPQITLDLCSLGCCHLHTSFVCTVQPHPNPRALTSSAPSAATFPCCLLPSFLRCRSCAPTTIYTTTT